MQILKGQINIRLVVGLIVIAIAFQGCKRDKPINFRFLLDDQYDSISVELYNTASDEVIRLNSKEDFTYRLTDEYESIYEVKMAGYKNGSSDTLAFYSRRCQIGYEGVDCYMMFPTAVAYSYKELELYYEQQYILATWTNIGSSIHGNKKPEFYVSTDSSNIFNEENRVEVERNEFRIDRTNEQKYIAFRRLLNNNYSNGYSKSEVFPIKFNTSYYQLGEIGEWIEYEMVSTDELVWKIPVTQYEWYIAELYDGLNSPELTANGILVSTYFTINENTRNPVGKMPLISSNFDYNIVRINLAENGTFGTFKFRIREITPGIYQPLQGEHAFTENSQVLFASKYLEAGTYNITTYQNDILNESFVYYSLFKNGEIATVKDFDIERMAFNIGPNSSSDTASRHTVLTLDQAAEIQMIMINSYHGTPGSLFVEIN